MHGSSASAKTVHVDWMQKKRGRNEDIGFEIVRSGAVIVVRNYVLFVPQVVANQSVQFSVKVR